MYGMGRQSLFILRIAMHTDCERARDKRSRRQIGFDFPLLTAGCIPSGQTSRDSSTPFTLISIVHPGKRGVLSQFSQGKALEEGTAWLEYKGLPSLRFPSQLCWGGQVCGAHKEESPMLLHDSCCRLVRALNGSS